MNAEFKTSLRCISIAILWMLVPAILTASPLYFPFSEQALYWCMIGLFGCVTVPVFAGVVHRSRGIGYACGMLGVIVFVFGLISATTMFNWLI